MENVVSLEHMPSRTALNPTASNPARSRETGPAATGSLRQLDFPPDVFWGTTEEDVTQQVLSGSLPCPPLGQFAIVHTDGDSCLLIRDRLGINKLFYHLDAESGRITAGHYLYDVAAVTGDCNQVRSVPAGHRVTIDERSAGGSLTSYSDLSGIRPDPATEFDPEKFQKRLDGELTRLFVELNRMKPSGPFFVCLSGGLDSTVIAAYASRHLRNVTAVSFSYERLSDDFRAAELTASRLGLPFLPVIANRRFDIDVLDDVLRYGQDWRDFNVHCAWVNYHIARELSAVAGAGATVLTGDLMNEYVADYGPVEFNGTMYYPQPRVPRDKLRRFLVSGLDAGDREIGIFHRFGLTAIQPYSVVAEAYLSVPAEFLAMDGSKERLNRALLRDSGLAENLLRGKVRAQVGSSDGGTLGLFHETGVTQDTLSDRWEKLFLPLARERPLSPIILAGRYRH